MNGAEATANNGRSYAIAVLAGLAVLYTLYFARAFLLPIAFAKMFSPQVASNLGPSISSILIYVLMAAVLFFRPQGLFPARG